MSIRVTPVIFLLDVGAGLGLLSLFVGFSAHQRLQEKSHRLVSKADKSGIYLAVITTSLFLLWSSGAVLGAYFGMYEIFQADLPPAYLNLLKIEALVDIFQKMLGFFILALAGFQNAYVGDKHVLVPWGKTCASLGCIQAFLFILMLVSFKGVYGWMLLYVLSAVVDGVIVLFAALSCTLLLHDKQTAGIAGYLPAKICKWNISVCLLIGLAALLDGIAKACLVALELYGRNSASLLIDMCGMLRCAATSLFVFTAYFGRIPKSKAYSTTASN
ncbi:hypothetical protein NEHOM01_1436 [Nematocida homosporus]|uniref:uncharacterized protein n=1 Tax=Nematocida homosporus TaxID=1912981 RepID=UPI0022210BD1|nr:uncharacterized protein NEHOM01_1436 [Nematocida homosporus]KAI5186382.1 hypothetical protein NEHOM01_1436 [Nematocida homosporus]